MKELVSGVSQRRIAFLFSTTRVTVARKLKHMARISRSELTQFWSNKNPIYEVQFDELETFEHTKLKPLSVVLMVEKHTRYILGFRVAKMPAKGYLAKMARKKYGYRLDERGIEREKFFRSIKEYVQDRAIIESDKNPHYPPLVRRYFPKSVHLTTEGRRGCVTGQGELKRVIFDPLFSLNHTCAMLRANINRLFRKTWCTTKKVECLIDHLSLYVNFHNQVLIKA